MNNQKQLKKELDGFMDIVCLGIRGEYEQGWSHRKIKEDKKTLFNFIKNIIKYN